MTPAQLKVKLAVAALQFTYNRALTLKALIQRRVQETGTNFEGTSYESIAPYDPKYLRFKKRKRKYTGKVDFTLNQQMWPKINAINAVQDGYKVTVTVAGTDVETQDKMDGNFDRRGDFLTPSIEEIETTNIETDNDLQQLLNEIFP